MADDAPIYKNETSPKKKSAYDTKLSEKDEAAYQKWVKEKGVSESDDYDMRGFFKDKDASRADNGHYPDTYKKPNHPTFSNESKYSGVDGNEGGEWKKADGKWTFKPGKTNIGNGLDTTRGYLKDNDPDVTLIEPPSPESP